MATHKILHIVFKGGAEQGIAGTPAELDALRRAFEDFVRDPAREPLFRGRYAAGTGAVSLDLRDVALIAGIT